MKELVFLLAADVDIQTIHDLYEDRQEGKGTAFMHRLDECLGQLRQFSESAPVIYKQYRRLLIPKSPYGIFYAVHPHRITVRAIFDLRRGRAYMIQRLSD